MTPELENTLRELIIEIEKEIGRSVPPGESTLFPFLAYSLLRLIHSYDFLGQAAARVALEVILSVKKETPLTNDIPDDEQDFREDLYRRAEETILRHQKEGKFPLKPNP